MMNIGCPSDRARLRAVLWLLLLMAGSMLSLVSLSPQATTSQRHALILTIDGPIGPATADYIARGIGQARERRSAVLVLQMDTPGGLDTSMREIIRRIVNAPVPVLTWIGPSGARAASAGTYILYASHVAAMAPGTNLGAATPVAIGGGLPLPGRGDEKADRPEQGGSQKRDGARDDAAEPSGGNQSGSAERSAERGPSGASERAKPGSAMEAKAINDAVAYIRSLAEMRGRNADWAESAVRDASSLSAQAASERGVIDMVATGIDDMLKQAHGRTVKLGATPVVLDTEGLAQQAFDPDWRTRLLSVITNPNVALILMMIGFYGLVFEFMNPGALYPGTIGAISLLVGLYALAALPLNFAGLALIVLGVALMIAEAFSPSFGILGIGGVIAFMLGATIMMDTGEVPGFELSWPIIGGVAVASLGFTLLVGRLALKSRRSRPVSGRDAMLGMSAQVVDWSGERGHVVANGERWNARAAAPLQAGQRVRITGIDGLILEVSPDRAEH